MERVKHYGCSIDYRIAIDWSVFRGCFRHVWRRGGLLIVPALIYLAKFSQHAAIGTSLAILLPPVGLLAVLEYYRHGNVNLKAALIVAIAFMVGGWLGAHLANHINTDHLKLLFGIFVLAIGGYLVFSAVKSMT